MENIDFGFCIPECGLCCKVLNYIHASKQDIERLKQNGVDADFLIESGSIKKRLNGKNEEYYTLKDDRSDTACVFYKEKGICSVHEFKPDMCRDFPFGKEDKLKKYDECPATIIRRLEEKGYKIRGIVRKKWLEKRDDKDGIFKIIGVIAVLRNVFVYNDSFEGVSEISEKTIDFLYEHENLEKWLAEKQEPIIKKTSKRI